MNIILKIWNYFCLPREVEHEYQDIYIKNLKNNNDNNINDNNSSDNKEDNDNIIIIDNMIEKVVGSMLFDKDLEYGENKKNKEINPNVYNIDNNNLNNNIDNCEKCIKSDDMYINKEISPIITIKPFSDIKYPYINNNNIKNCIRLNEKNKKNYIILNDKYNEKNRYNIYNRYNRYNKYNEYNRYNQYNQYTDFKQSFSL